MQMFAMGECVPIESKGGLVRKLGLAGSSRVESVSDCLLTRLPFGEMVCKLDQPAPSPFLSLEDLANTPVHLAPLPDRQVSSDHFRDHRVPEFTAVFSPLSYFTDNLFLDKLDQTFLQIL